MNKKYLLLVFICLFGLQIHCYYFKNETEFKLTILDNDNGENLLKISPDEASLMPPCNNNVITKLINTKSISLRIADYGYGKQKIQLKQIKQIIDEEYACFIFTKEGSGSKLVLKICNFINKNPLSWDSDNPAFIGECELRQSNEKEQPIEYNDESDEFDESSSKKNLFSDKRISYSLAGLGTIILGYWAYNKYFSDKKDDQKRNSLI